MRVRSIAGIAVGTATLMCATVLPAAATNVDLAVGPPGAPKFHHGIWKDATDVLGACLGGGSGYYKLVVGIKPADGVGPVFSMTDTVRGSGCKYTGNLSIPEDERYIMTLTAYSSLSGKLVDSVAFYT
jgi:hypothetical protein